MAIFNSYIKLPEGMVDEWLMNGWWMVDESNISSGMGLC